MEVNTYAERLFYTTLKIETFSSGGDGAGTGFIFSYKVREKHDYLFLVTNKHVIAGTTKGKITFHIGENNQPKLGESFTLYFEEADWSKMWFGHLDPNIDIAICGFVPLINHIKSSFHKEIFFTAISDLNIPTNEQLNKLDALETVTFAGYPNGIWDNVNHLPIVRKGVTATPLSINFENKPKFLIDASVFGGSSGSPVVLLDNGMYADKSGNAYVGNRFHFLGVIAAVYFKNSVSEVIPLPIPTSHNSVVNQKEMIDLGIVFKANTVVEAIEAFCQINGLELKNKI